MTISVRILVKGTVWTTGAYGIGQVVRLATNIILARLLAPEIFGVIWTVYSLQTGIELISDVGIGQNIVYNKNAENPEFYNTAWTLQLIRSTALWLVFTAAAPLVAYFYRAPILGFVIPISAFSIVLSGVSSMGKPLLQKRLMIARLNAFDVTMHFISSAVMVLFAYLSPTIWGLVIGGVVGGVPQTIGSYFLLSDVKQKFFISKNFVWEILSFGKWIAFASIVFFLSRYVDRLYLAKVVPMELVGVYGIARSIAGLSSDLVLRLGGVVLFPFVAAHANTPRKEFREQLAPVRARFLLLSALGFSFAVSMADFAIKILYDERYHAATWMLPVLVVGSWFAILANVNELTLLGLGKPSYGAISNSFKLIWLVIGLPLSLNFYGLVGGVSVIALADLPRCVPILIGQRRERFSFALQDVAITLAAFALIVLLEWFRWILGFGTSFDTVPLDVPFGVGR